MQSVGATAVRLLVMRWAEPHHIEWPAVVRVMRLWFGAALRDSTARPWLDLPVSDRGIQDVASLVLQRIPPVVAVGCRCMRQAVRLGLLVQSSCSHPMRHATTKAVVGLDLLQVGLPIGGNLCPPAWPAGAVSCIEIGHAFVVATCLANHGQKGIWSSMSSKPVPDFGCGCGAGRSRCGGGGSSPPAPPRLSFPSVPRRGRPGRH